MDEFEITAHGTPQKGEYRINLPGVEEPAVLTWVGNESVRIGNHTYVPDAMRGRGIAGLLAQRLVEDARREGFSIVPKCSYLEVAFKRHPEWEDLRHKG